MPLRTVTAPAELRGLCREARAGHRKIGLVPTMGALHAGHLSLVTVARERADLVVLTVFVNPTQFGPGEDLAAYPRALERDRRLAEEAGTDVLFHPAPEAMYPEGDATRVEVSELTELLCGASRPGHFRGVATVVAKLLILCDPHVAVFGRKDYQQWRVIQRMARDLLLEAEIVGAPIVRDPDGLALSSRNAYLSPGERRAALALPRALDAGTAAMMAGERAPAPVIERMRAVVADEPGARIDYLEVVDAHHLQRVDRLAGDLLLAGAIQVGRARLIDNREVQLEGREG
ncbi:MAG: pantoate--beta-alanine ligase [Acidobacteriota bacterium]|jgi:pantoate--beta-alanine ligase